MHVSVGGHFLDGAWAAVLLYDYLNNIDFANESLQFESPMVGITRANLIRFSAFLSLDRKSLNFRLFSKALNQQLKLYSFDLLPENLRESRKAHFNKVLQTGEPADFEDVRDEMTFHNIYYPVRDKARAIMGVAIFAQDITERKRAEEAIRESQERLSTILKTTNQGFWLVDNDTITLDVNAAMCEILGLPKDEIVGRNFFDFLDEKNREIVREQNRIRKKGIQSIYEISLIQPDGQHVPCLLNASPLLDKAGRVIGSFGMTTNIAERKQMEEELRRNVDELERFSKVAFGREKKMIQLKQEINELMSQLGQGEKYKIVT